MLKASLRSASRKEKSEQSADGGTVIAGLEQEGLVMDVRLLLVLVGWKVGDSKLL